MKVQEAVNLGVTAFTKSVKQPTEVTLLKSSKANKKLGNSSEIIMKGAWKGMPLFSLTLQERATCPSTCNFWATCYGNNMPFAHRINHKNKNFLPLLEKELDTLAKTYSFGFVVRLHVLGDFYSPEYVNFWIRMIAKHPQLRIYGYTARIAGKIHDALKGLLSSDRVWIRFSSVPTNKTAMFATNAANNVKGIVCPVQTKKTASCLTCALCWSTKQTILFIEH